MQEVYKHHLTIQFNLNIAMNGYMSSNKTVLQSNSIINPINLWADTLQPIKSKNYILVRLLNNPQSIVHYLPNLVSIIGYKCISSIYFLHTSEDQAISSNLSLLIQDVSFQQDLMTIPNRIYIKRFSTITIVLSPI